MSFRPHPATLDGTQGTISGARYWTWVGCMQNTCSTHCNYCPGPWFHPLLQLHSSSLWVYTYSFSLVLSIVGYLDNFHILFMVLSTATSIEIHIILDEFFLCFGGKMLWSEITGLWGIFVFPVFCRIGLSGYSTISGWGLCYQFSPALVVSSLLLFLSFSFLFFVYLFLGHT